MCPSQRRIENLIGNCSFQTVVASIDPAKLRPPSEIVVASASSEKLPCPPGFEASMEWQLEQVALFSEVRQKFSLQKQRDVRSKTTPAGGEALAKVSTAAQWTERIESEADLPLVSVVASIPGSRILQLIRE